MINFFLIFSYSHCGTTHVIREILHGPVSVHTWTGVLSVLDGHSHKDTECCKDTAPVWQEDWWTEPCSGRLDEPSACPSLWGSVVGSSGPCPAENTCSSPLCPLFCGNDGQSQAGSDLCDPWWPLHTGPANLNTWGKWWEAVCSSVYRKPLFFKVKSTHGNVFKFCLGSYSSHMPDAVKVHPRLPHHFTGKSQHELITSQRDSKRIKFTKYRHPYNNVLLLHRSHC